VNRADERPVHLVAHPVYPSRESLERAAAVLREDGVAFPTETLYGIGGAHASERAAVRVRVEKGLAPDAPLLLLAPDLEWVYRLSSGGAIVRELAARFWPGPLTLLLPASSLVPPWIAPSGGGVALRVAGDSAGAALAALLGSPLVATSANRHGDRPASSGAEVLNIFGAGVDVVLDGGPREGGKPSTLIDLTAGPPRLMRAGAIAPSELAPWIAAAGAA